MCKEMCDSWCIQCGMYMHTWMLDFYWYSIVLKIRIWLLCAVMCCISSCLHCRGSNTHSIVQVQSNVAQDIGYLQCTQREHIILRSRDIVRCILSFALLEDLVETQLINTTWRDASVYIIQHPYIWDCTSNWPIRIVGAVRKISVECAFSTHSRIYLHTRLEPLFPYDARTDHLPCTILPR
jgi:hypothetical protein